MRKRFDVKPTSTNNDRQFFAQMNFIDRALRGCAEFLHVHFFLKRHRADEMMRRFRKHFGIRLCRQKIESAVNLESVRVDNLRADFLPDISRQFGFTSRGGSDDEECALHNRLYGLSMKRRKLASASHTDALHRCQKTKSGDVRICAASPD